MSVWEKIIMQVIEKLLAYTPLSASQLLHLPEYLHLKHDFAASLTLLESGQLVWLRKTFWSLECKYGD